MTPPRTRLTEATTEFERELLRSWGDEQPSARARDGALALILGAGAPGVGTAVGAGRVGGVTATKLGALVGKWLAAGVLVIGAADVTLDRMQSHPATSGAPAAAAPEASKGVRSLPVALPPVPTSPILIPVPSAATATPGTTRLASATRVAPSAVRPSFAATPSASPPAIAAPVTTPVATADLATAPSAKVDVSIPSVAAPVPSDDGPPKLALGAQVEAIDRVRSALRRGDVAEALARIDAYEHAFPYGLLAEEATALRVEALWKSGDRPAAWALADRFLASHPASPAAGRVRRLLGPAAASRDPASNP